MVAVRRNKTGNYTSFILNNGQLLNYQQAVEMPYQGGSRMLKPPI